MARPAVLAIGPWLPDSPLVAHLTDTPLRHCRRRNRALPAGIHVDTCLSRLGFPMEELRTLAENEQGLSELTTALFMSQLACAEWKSEVSLQQKYGFRKLTHLLSKAMLSLSNSAGLFAGRQFHFDLIRPGGGLFGFFTSDHPCFKPSQVVSLRTQIIQCRELRLGDAIGYHQSYKVRRRMRVATVSTGYGDGFPRILGNRGHVFICGTRVPIVGFVSMNLTTIDVTEPPEMDCAGYLGGSDLPRANYGGLGFSGKYAER